MANRYGIIRFEDYSGFIIESSSGRGNIGVVLFSGTSELDDLRRTLSGQSEGSEPWIAVRLRPELSPTATILMRRNAPGRPVFVMEPVPYPGPITDAKTQLPWPILFSFLSIGCAALFAVFRILEVRSPTNRLKYPGEDQPWRSAKTPTLWSKHDRTPHKSKRL